jgi:hypothetical protein
MANSIIGGKTRPLKLKRIRLLVTLSSALLAIVAPTAAFADAWGCQVLLCLADPRGPETELQCKPPIEKLWHALAHGEPFPSCDLMNSVSDLPPDIKSVLPPSVFVADHGAGAQTVGAGPNYCSPELLFWGPPEQSMLTCGARGVINVTVNSKLFTRVWWSPNGMVRSEFYGQGSTTTPYDPSTAKQQFLSQTSDGELKGANETDGGGNH